MNYLKIYTIIARQKYVIGPRYNLAFEAERPKAKVHAAVHYKYTYSHDYT